MNREGVIMKDRVALDHAAVALAEDEIDVGIVQQLVVHDPRFAEVGCDAVGPHV
jgi:hypothetical protein